MSDAVRATALGLAGPEGAGVCPLLHMAEAITVLWTRYLRFDAADPRWLDRDRFVLSAAGGTPLLHALLHLTGDGRDAGARAAAAPAGNGFALGRDGAAELAAGLAGQGVAAAVGMALAERMLAARFGRSLVDHRTWIIASAGDLAEGAGQEAIALAGHYRLDRMTCLFDDGPDDGAAAWAIEQFRRLASGGWAVKQVDGDDPAQIAGALSFAIRSKKPTLIACRTRQSPPGAARSDGGDLAALPEQEAERWQLAGRRGAAARRSWLKRLARHPRRPEFERVMAGRLPETWQDGVATLKAAFAQSQQAVAPSEASERVIEAFLPTVTELLAGAVRGGQARGLAEVTPGSFGGRSLDFGFGKHGMAAALSGLASHGGLIPFARSSVVASDWVRPALRLDAMLGQRVIHLLTHGPDGGAGGGPPWPAEHLPSLRAMPGLLVFRPADAVETAECWELAMRRGDGPSLLVLAEQSLPALRAEAAENRCARGGYVLAEADGPRHATLIATGPEVAVAMEARHLLAAGRIAVAVVSLPCWELFEVQDAAIRAQVLGAALRVGIEAGNGFGWDRWLGEDGVFIGHSGRGASVYAPCGDRPPDITAAEVAASVRRRLGDLGFETDLPLEGSTE
ncbi:MAG: transketolase [Acetobacteraceae bacterium]|nr:transketolase [Acetobacteraceae bacterium]